MLAAGAANAADDDAVWGEYLAWLRGRAVGDLVGLESYRKELEGRGLAKSEVERRMKVLSEHSLKRPEAMRLWFNSMFGPEGPTGPDWPTPFLMECVKDVKPGTSLDVCMGEGRNSVYLARLGWKATGFDVSDVAIEHALEKAKAAGVRITAVRAGYQEFDFGREKWDLVVMTYAYFPIRERRNVDALVASMRRGGLLVFQYGVLPKGAGRSGDASMLGIPEEGELRETFRALRMERYEEVEEVSDWQTGAGGRRGRQVKMLARKQ